MKKRTKMELGLSIFEKLKKQYPQAKIALEFNSDMELLAATILSAQCTDKRVNQITSKLFIKYRNVQEYADADLKALEGAIRSAGLYHSKARNIIESAKIIEYKLRGEIPRNIQELILLPGVGRKTANVVLYNAFGKNEGIAVDTHVRRLSKRLGLTQENNPDKIEQDLKQVFLKKNWGRVNHLFIAHGRSICVAQNPKCKICQINSFCTYNKKNRVISHK